MIAIFILGCRVLWESASQLALSLSGPPETTRLVLCSSVRALLGD